MIACGKKGVNAGAGSEGGKKNGGTFRRYAEEVKKKKEGLSVEGKRGDFRCCGI